MAEKISGSYPWLVFKGHSKEQWEDWYGFDTVFIDRGAVDIYLEGENEFFDGYGETYREDTKQRALEDLRTQFLNAAINLCQSPIEQRMLSALIWLSYGYRHAPVEIWDTSMPFGKPQTDVVVAPQYKVDKYTLDFAIFINGIASEEIRIAIECDGHAFHEKTKEQAAHDKRRDRDIQIAGYLLLRFTGSEIWKDWYACVSQVDTLAMNEIDKQLRRRGLLK